MDLSIIIISYNTCELLKRCLKSVFEESSRMECEVFVVDNGSIDGSPEMVRNEYPEVHLILNQKNRGFAAANNQGISVARGEFVLLLNSDTIVLKGALQNTLHFMLGHPEASIVGCRLLNQEGNTQQSCRSFPSVVNILFESSFLYKLFPKSSVIGKYHLGWFDYNKVLEVDVVQGAFMMIRRSVFDKIGVFDERFFMYTEETDFCFRAKAVGLKVFYYPGTSAVHLGGQSSLNSEEQKFLDIHKTHFQFFRMHYSTIEYICMSILKWVGMLVRIPIYFVKGIASINPSELRKARYYTRALLPSLIWMLKSDNFSPVNRATQPNNIMDRRYGAIVKKR